MSAPGLNKHDVFWGGSVLLFGEVAAFVSVQKEMGWFSLCIGNPKG